MKRSTRLILGIATAAILGNFRPAAAQSATDQQLLDEVRALRSEVNALKRQQATSAPALNTPAAIAPATTNGLATPAMTSPDTSAINTAAAVQTDAQTHTAKPGNAFNDFMTGFTLERFTLQSNDGKFVLRPWLHLQLRDVTSVRQDFKADGSNDVQNGFELRRVRFGVDGNLFSPDLTYMFNWATVRASGTATVTSGGRTVGTVSNNLGGTPLLEEAWLRYKLPGTNIFLRGGQIKDPVYHESIVSSRYQQSTERSLTADIFFNGDTFAEGVTIGYDPKTWVRAEAGIDHGLRSANTNFLDYPNTNAFNFGVVGRAEFKLFGRWQDYQMGAAGVKEPLLVAGIGGEASERGHANQTVAAADIMYTDASGLSLFGAFADRYTDHNFGIATQSASGASITAPPANVLNTATNEYALVGQAGYLFFNHLEPFGRFEYLHLQGTAAGSHNYIPVITTGANYYFYGHRCKLTGQASYLPNGIPIDDTPNDVLASPNGQGEFLFVAQFQLLL